MSPKIEKLLPKKQIIPKETMIKDKKQRKSRHIKREKPGNKKALQIYVSDDYVWKVLLDVSPSYPFKLLDRFADPEYDEECIDFYCAFHNNSEFFKYEKKYDNYHCTFHDDKSQEYDWELSSIGNDMVLSDDQGSFYSKGTEKTLSDVSTIMNQLVNYLDEVK